MITGISVKSQARTVKNSAVKAANCDVLMFVYKFTTYKATFFANNITGICNVQNIIITYPTIINLQDSDKKGSHWVSYKKMVIKYFILIRMGLVLYQIL